MSHIPLDLDLSPGGFYFGDDRSRIRTLLGSCVSIILWNRERRIGGMCHFLSPSRESPSRESPSRESPSREGPSRESRPGADPDPRYADEAMALFRQRAAEAGTPLASYAAKIFGGGSQFTGSAGLAPSDIPARNVAAGRRLLAGHGLTVVASHVGGQGPRSVIFEVDTGDVWVRHENSLT